MDLLDKLEELDEAIWKQYEKVTQYCNKEFGWNKYDLAQKSNTAFVAAFVGENIYWGLEGVLGSSPGTLIGTIVNVSLGGFAFYSMRKNLHSQEKREESQLEEGIIFPPHRRFWRPLAFSFPLWKSAKSVYDFCGHKQLPEYMNKISHENYNLLEGLASACSALAIFFLLSATYFGDQIPTLPKKKKSFLKAIGEKITGKISDVPQLEPVKETKYQSIDDMVAGE